MSSMTLLSFCRRFNSRSPCLIADWYCAFFASGLVVSITPATCGESKHLSSLYIAVDGLDSNSGHSYERQQAPPYLLC